MELTWAYLIALATADAVNPCALAVLFVMLIAIMLYNPNKKIKILEAGLAFTFSVFFMYFLYGIILVGIFTVAGNFLKVFSRYFYILFGVLAMLLGLLGIKDYFSYKPGTIGTEMPIMLRPKVKKILSKVTSVKGAVVAGILVTLFLLPCTMGPYIIFAGLISQNLGLTFAELIQEIFQILPFLGVYNLIFVLPMLIITLLVYFGFTTVKQAEDWKNKNVRILHLIAGVILFIFGVIILFKVF